MGGTWGFRRPICGMEARPGLQPRQPLAQTGPAAAGQALVAHESPAAPGEDRGPPGEACAVLLAPAGRGASDPAAVRRHAAEDLGATGARRLTRGLSATKRRRQGTRVERCLRNTLKAAAPVGSTSAWAEVTASGAGRLCDEKNFVRSAALGCIKVASGASKSEIPDKGPDSPAKMEIPARDLPHRRYRHFGEHQETTQ